MNLALFDFDGTLTTKDSLGEFIRYCVGDLKYYLGLVRFIPLFLAWKLGMIRNDEAKINLFRLFFTGHKQKEFMEKGSKYAKEEIKKILRPSTYKLFLEHIKKGDRVIVVSASMSCWLKPWCESQGVELLSTELLFEDGVFSGHFATANCHGVEKVNRIKQHLNLNDYETIYAYGDSSGDKEMLELSHKSFYKLK